MATNLGNIKIKVQIANRAYPLTISSADEEIVRRAAKEISEKVKKVTNTFSAKDNQDLVAIVALEYATLYIKQIQMVMDENKTNIKMEQLLDKVSSEIHSIESQFE